MAQRGQQQNQGDQNPPALAAPAVVFARSPAGSAALILNYRTKEDATIYFKGCKALDGDPYDGNGLPEFLARLQSKAEALEWESLFQINNRDLLVNYAELTAAQVQAAAMIYQTANDR
jgi:hypothetical protein